MNMATWRKAATNLQRIIRASAARNPSPLSSSSPSRFQSLFRPQYRLVSPYSSDAGKSLDIDFSNEESKRRLLNRLKYRSKQRGFLELDLVLGNWVEQHIHSMDETGIRALADVLDLENPDLWKWVSGQQQPPELLKTNPVFSAIHKNVMSNLDSHSSPETRATPGQPWVRGWDDFKKGRDGPVSGNQ